MRQEDHKLETILSYTLVRYQWLMPVILIGRIIVGGQPRQIVRETPPHAKITRAK
jgi:hypothetical protein